MNIRQDFIMSKLSHEYQRGFLSEVSYRMNIREDFIKTKLSCEYQRGFYQK